MIRARQFYGQARVNDRRVELVGLVEVYGKPPGYAGVTASSLLEPHRQVRSEIHGQDGSQFNT